MPRCVIQMSPGRSRMKASVSRRTPWKRLWTTMMRTTGECNASDGEEQLYLVRKQIPGVTGSWCNRNHKTLSLGTACEPRDYANLRGRGTGVKANCPAVSRSDSLPTRPP